MNKNNNDIELIMLDKHNMKPLIDYINELQQENEELNDNITWWNNRFNAVQRDYEDYKTRIEKAVEYINKKWEEHTYYERNENHLGFCEFSVFEKNDLLNILRGEDE